MVEDQSQLDSKRRRCSCPEREPSPNWSQLQPDLLELIFKKHPTVMDIVRFKAVCSPWRSTAISYTSDPFYIAPQNPCLMFQVDPSDNNKQHSCLFDPVGKTVYELKNVFKYTPVDHSQCLGSSHGWLTFQHHFNQAIYLYNPLTRACIEFPPLPASDDHRPYGFENCKVIVSANPSSENNFAVAVLAGGPGGYVLFCNNEDKAWRMLKGNSSRLKGYQDIMFQKEHLYAVKLENLSLDVWDCCESPPVLTSIFAQGYGPEALHHRTYLAESKMGHILRVVKCRKRKYMSKFRFYVQKLNRASRKWEKLESLGDEMLFVFKDQVTSLCYKQISGCEENSVYNFDDSEFGNQRQAEGIGHVIGQHKLDEDDGFFKRGYRITSFFDCPDLRPLSYCTHRRLFWFIPTV